MGCPAGITLSLPLPPQRSRGGAGTGDAHPPHWPFSEWGVERSVRIWDILIFICDAKEKNQSLYPDNALQKHKLSQDNPGPNEGIGKCFYSFTNLNWIPRACPTSE